MAKRAAATGRLPTTEGNRPTQPWTVTVALVLLGIVVVTLLAAAAHSIEATIRVQRLLPQVAKATGATQSQMAQERIINAAIGLALTAVQGLVAAVLAALAVWVQRGHQTARIMLVAVAGLLSTCCSWGAGIAGRSTSESSESLFVEELARLTVATQPSWVSALELPSRAVGIVLPLVALALLLMPPSNRFFRQQRAVTLPPARNLPMTDGIK
ncbi:hypothetical protein [Micromonospora sp. URMC 103]|uniref:hypothetical protein n=1 Tax=Micromonospora sp. URMC 103 TaxID=3423406 RepID=UPI003F1AB6CC